METYKQEFIEFMVDCQVLKFGDSGFKMALCFFSCIVFGVLGKVTLVTGFGYCSCGGRTLKCNKVVQLVFQFLKTFFAVIFDF